VIPRSNTVSLRTILSSPIPSKFKARLNVPDESAGTDVGVGKAVGTAVGSGVGAGVAVGTGVEVGVGGIAVGVGEGIDVEVGVAGTGVYRTRLSTHPAIANDNKPTSTTANLATCADRRAPRLRVANIIALRVDCREATTE